jgi:hypothetical protein
MAVLTRRQTRFVSNVFFFLLVLTTWVFVICAGIVQGQRAIVGYNGY